MVPEFCQFEYEIGDIVWKMQYCGAPAIKCKVVERGYVIRGTRAQKLVEPEDAMYFVTEADLDPVKFGPPVTTKDDTHHIYDNYPVNYTCGYRLASVNDSERVFISDNGMLALFKDHPEWVGV